jgi:hypothetical protein
MTLNRNVIEEKGDFFTVIFMLFVLGLIGYTIYSYLKQGTYSHYALAISIISCVGLVFLTRKTDRERDREEGARAFNGVGSVYFPRILAWGSPRSLAWGGKKARR